MKAKNTTQKARRRAFWKGYASVFDLSFSPRVIQYEGPCILDFDEALRQDAEKLRGDWRRVGQDIFTAAKQEGR